MDPKTRVLFVQLQIASVGVLLGVFGWLWKENWLLITGFLVFAYGLIRAFLFSRLMEKNQESSKDDSYGFEDFYASHEDEDEEQDEWERALERHFERKYDSSLNSEENTNQKK